MPYVGQEFVTTPQVILDLIYLSCLLDINYIKNTMLPLIAITYKYLPHTRNAGNEINLTGYCYSCLHLNKNELSFIDVKVIHPRSYGTGQ